MLLIKIVLLNGNMSEMEEAQHDTNSIIAFYDNIIKFNNKEKGKKL